MDAAYRMTKLAMRGAFDNSSQARPAAAFFSAANACAAAGAWQPVGMPFRLKQCSMDASVSF